MHTETGDWAIIIGMAGEALIWALEEAVTKLSDFRSDFAANDWNENFTKAIDRLARAPSAER